jgi:hypothetical protein
MNSMVFSPSSKSNSKIDGNHVNFGTVDFQPHQPTLVPVFATLDQKMDLTIGSFNFRVGSLGSIRLLDPTNLGPFAGKNRNCGDFRNIGGFIQRGKVAGQHEADE